MGAEFNRFRLRDFHMAEGAEISRDIQFARDLKEIRQSNGISIDDIHNESKIPVGLIESFEESGLFDHTMFNRVYLRSFVRTYADSIGISPDLALSSLEAALEGTYQRELAVEYLGLEPAPEPTTDSDDTIIPEPDPEIESTATAAPDRSSSSSTPVAPAPPIPPAYHEDEEEEEVDDLQIASSPALSEPERDWTSQSPPPGTAVAPTRRSGGGSQWIYLLLAAVVVLGLVWGVVELSGGRDASPSSAELVAADTVDADTIAIEAPSAPPPVALGDTMHVTIASADSQLVQDIKVTVDDDLRRPYWLEAGESRSFSATNQIVIEQELDVIDLRLEGRPYPTDRVDAQGRIVITRDVAREFLAGAQ